MKAYSFGRLNVVTAGTLIQLGTSVLTAPVAPVDTTITILSPYAFSKDMLPFNAFLATELLSVTAINYGTGVCTVTRTAPVAHAVTDKLQVNFQFTKLFASVVAGLTGKMYLGTTNLVAGSVGVIKEFWPNAAGGVNDNFELSASDPRKNLFNLNDYKIDAAINGEGLYLTVWAR